MRSAFWALLPPLLVPLGRELRASIDFFEHQEDKQVVGAFFSGGLSRSELAVNALHSELLIQCHPWNPFASFELALPPDQLAVAEAHASQFAVAVGGAIAVASVQNNVRASVGDRTEIAAGTGANDAVVIDANGKNALDAAFDKTKVVQYGFIPQGGGGAYGLPRFAEVVAQGAFEIALKIEYRVGFELPAGGDEVAKLADLPADEQKKLQEQK